MYGPNTLRALSRRDRRREEWARSDPGRDVFALIAVTLVFLVVLRVAHWAGVL